MKASRALVISLVALATAAWAADEVLTRGRQTYEQAQIDIRLQFEKDIAGARERYRAELENLERRLRSEGALKGILSVRAERARMAQEDQEASPRLAEEEPQVTRYQDAFRVACLAAEEHRSARARKLAWSYADFLDKRKVALTKAGQLDEAVAVKGEAQRIRERYPQADTPNVAEAAAPPAALSPGVRKAATLYITCDNRYTVWLNGRRAGEGSAWEKLDAYDLSIADNDILAIEAADGEAGRNSAGLYCCLVLREGGRVWASNPRWTCSTRKPAGSWQSSPLGFFGEAVSDNNVHPSHRDRVASYSERGPLRGSFIWSESASPTIYVKQRILLRDFAKP